MITIRPYRLDDAPNVGRLIATTYTKFNLSFLRPEERAPFLGPFLHAWSQQAAHQQEIAQAITADMVLVAEDNGEIVGVLRGRSGKLQSLFVREEDHRRGVGRRLVEHFEVGCARQGATVIKLQATLYAVPFYLSMGYKKTTGVRRMRSFAGAGLPYQPMKRVLRAMR
jgi:GNAT superfamily N-acetyltransferase